VNRNTADLNRAIRYGDELYSNVISAGYGGQQIFLMPSYLPRIVKYQGQHIEITYQVDQIHGIVNIHRQESLEQNFMAMPFRHGLTTAFLDSNFVLLTVGELTVALVYDNVHETFHVIDSHARNSMGEADPNGSAVILSFESLEDLFEYIERIYCNQIYNLTPVNLRYERHVSVSSCDKTDMQTLQCNDFHNVYHCDINGMEEDVNTYDPVHTSIHEQSEGHSDECESSVHYPSTILNHDHCYFNVDRQDGETISVNSNHSYSRIVCGVNLNALPKEFLFVNVSAHRTSDVHNSNINNLVQTDALTPPCENAEELSFKEKLLSASNVCNGTSIFPQYIESIQSKPSELCHSCKCFLYKRNTTIANKDFSHYGVSEGDVLCRKCYNKVKSNEMPEMSYVHNQLDVGQVPSVLQNLFVVEKRLLSLIPVFLTLVVLPGGQYAQHGIAVNIPININEQLNILQNCSSLHNGSVLVSFDRPNNEPVTLPVRISVVHQALMWLKENNHLYEHVDLTCFQKLYSSIEEMTVPTVCEDIIEEEFGLTSKDLVNPESVHMNTTDVNVQASIPVASQKPVNLKDIPFGEEKAFPWLFPYGRNGLSTERLVSLTDLGYWHCRLKNHDSRWRVDIPYVMASLNMSAILILQIIISTPMYYYKMYVASINIVILIFKEIKT